MIGRISKRLQDREDGFTLIELMVVVLIIAILIAIAIPTFLGARKRAQDRAAQSSLRNTVTAAKAIFTDRENYADATDTALASAEPSLTFKAGGSSSTDSTDVSVASATANTSGPKHNRFYAAALSDSGVCWYVQDIVGPTGTTNSGTTWEQAPNSSTTTCTANSAPAYNSGDWKKKPGDTA